jgi:hypothetical protein
MRREVIDCDYCKKTHDECRALRVAIDEQPCPAGGRSEVIYETIDLCPNCMSRSLQKFLTPLNYSQGSSWVESIKKKGNQT